MANQEYITELAANARRGVLELLSIESLQSTIMQYRVTVPSFKNWQATEENKKKFKKEVVDLIIWCEYGI
jgi:hypothetical protein